MEELNKYWVRNKTGRPFNYCGYTINTTGSMLLTEDEINGLGHYIHKKDIEVVGVESVSVKPVLENSQVVKANKSRNKKEKEDDI